jgi:hypothetical protein
MRRNRKLQRDVGENIESNLMKLGGTLGDDDILILLISLPES